MKAFFNHIRDSFFKGKLTQIVVDNINALLAEFEKFPGLDKRHLAYILATVYHETAGTMQPINEYGKGKNYDYGKKLKYGKGPGKRIAYTKPDLLYFGRGYTQNTWFENYEALTKAAQKAGLNWDFLNKPELLLIPGPSAWATLYAMNTGLYTGKKLTDYINPGKCDLVNARKIINGLDCAEKIAVYAAEFMEALELENPE